MEIAYIEPIYYAMDQGTGVALIRVEDRPAYGVLLDFMRGGKAGQLIRPGAMIPMAWEQLWDYKQGTDEIPGLFRWEAFKEWIAQWPDGEPEFRARWMKHFGMPGHDMADAVIIVWEQKRQ